VCPYLVFAARTPQSQHDPGQFIVGNIFTDPDIAARLDAHRFAEQHEMGANPTCRSCASPDSAAKAARRGHRRRGADRCGGHRGLPHHLRGAAAAAADDRMTSQRACLSVSTPRRVRQVHVAALPPPDLPATALPSADSRALADAAGQLIRAGTDEYAGWP